MFNRTYQTRASRGGMVSAGEILEELVERTADRQAFYRPRGSPLVELRPLKLMPSAPWFKFHAAD